MFFRSVLVLTASMAMLGLSNAQCLMENVIKPENAVKETDTKYCQTMGPERATFTMAISAISVPTFDADNPFAGWVDNTVFTIYNNDCIPIGVYAKPTCGIPYVIQAGMLPYELGITQINSGVGAGDFTFTYANGAYMIGENQCVCHDVSSGLEGAQICGCSFPVEGEPQ